MALLNPQTITYTGLVVTFAAASAGGDTIAPSANAHLRVKNAAASAVTVTVVVPGVTKYGQPLPDIAVAVAAGEERSIGPFPHDLRDPTSGLVSITYSAVASVTVALVTL